MFPVFDAKFRAREFRDSLWMSTLNSKRDTGLSNAKGWLILRDKLKTVHWGRLFVPEILGQLAMFLSKSQFLIDFRS